MADPVRAVTSEDRPPTHVEFALRVAWIAARIILVYYLGHSDFFFYQGF
jgi:hypothetical protein